MNVDILKKLNLKECLELVRVMNASVTDPMYVWDLEEDKVYFTLAISDVLALRPKENEGFEIQELLNLTYSVDKPRMDKGIFRVANGLETEFEIEYRVIDREGKRVWVNNKGQLIHIENGERRVIIGRCATSPWWMAETLPSWERRRCCAIVRPIVVS